MTMLFCSLLLFFPVALVVGAAGLVVWLVSQEGDK